LAAGRWARVEQREHNQHIVQNIVSRPRIVAVDIIVF
jgi:hypothetical protein